LRGSDIPVRPAKEYCPFKKISKPRRSFVKFEFQNPTHLIFGAGTLSQVGEVVHKHGKKALVVTGGVRVKPRGTTARHTVQSDSPHSAGN
jgi:hypothetical protein